MKPLIILRPEPGNAASVAVAQASGLEVIGAPIFEIEPVPGTIPLGRFDGILAGSANAFRHGADALSHLKHLPVYAVGETTALAARAAGFSVAIVGTGGLQAVLNALPPKPMRMLRVAGRDRVELAPPSGVDLVEQVVYAAVPKPLSPEVAAYLDRPAVIALHSATAAHHFAALVQERAHLSLACIGPRVAAAAGDGWGTVRSVARPDDAALLALAAEMCQTHAQ